MRNRTGKRLFGIIGALVAIAGVLLLVIFLPRASRQETMRPPSIFIAISDDQSWLHTHIAGDPVVKTPHFDRVARSGVFFTRVFSAAPSCSNSRAALLTGQQIWRLKDAANQGGPLRNEFDVYPDLLEAAGYKVGFTGKGWSPGDIEACGRSRNPAGNSYSQTIFNVLNFRNFLENLPHDQPFCFWFGSTEPHPPYRKGAAQREGGMDPQDVVVPRHVPDTPEMREYLVDYLFEIQAFDRDLGNMLKLLESHHRLHDTIIVVTSDNGIDFPRAKATLYDLGTRVPLAIWWPEKMTGGRVIDDLVSLTDIAPTFLAAAGVEIPKDVTGKSLLNILLSDRSGSIDATRRQVFTGRERHSPYREGNVGYPMRAIRTDKFLYIRNFAPDRWPAGDPPHYADPPGEYRPKLAILEMKDSDEGRYFFDLCYGKRPKEELYDLEKDPDQLVNVASDPEYTDTKRELWRRLRAYLEETGDPRAFGRDGGWDSMPWHGEFTYPGFENN
ncbi:MAG: sulfatase [Candidatus Latescibacterota bacterium]|nr:MAG: sulfatase [Candidatus Latescibacterota bacterium]